MEAVVPVVPDPVALPAAGAGIDGVLFGTTNGLMPVAPRDVVVPPDVAPLCVERPPGVVAPAAPPPISVVCARAGVAMQSVAIAMYNTFIMAPLGVVDASPTPVTGRVAEYCIRERICCIVRGGSV
jgi:hypothetical protein